MTVKPEWCRERAALATKLAGDFRASEFAAGRAAGADQETFAAALTIAARVLDEGATAKLRDIFRHHYQADPTERGFVTATDRVLAYLKGEPNGH